MITTVHHVPGRLRVRCPSLRRDAVRAAAAEDILRALPGVASAGANALTGTIVVQYDASSTEVRSILRALERGGFGSGAAVRRKAGGQDLAHAFADMLVKAALERSAAALIGALI